MPSPERYRATVTLGSEVVASVPPVEDYDEVLARVAGALGLEADDLDVSEIEDSRATYETPVGARVVVETVWQWAN